jgi:hypothetical protein
VEVPISGKDHDDNQGKIESQPGSEFQSKPSLEEFTQFILAISQENVQMDSDE